MSLCAVRYLRLNNLRDRGMKALNTWWRHKMEICSTLVALCASQWRGALMFSLIWAWIKRLSIQSWGWWFETPSCSLWRHCKDIMYVCWHTVEMCKLYWYNTSQEYSQDSYALLCFWYLISSLTGTLVLHLLYPSRYCHWHSRTHDDAIQWNIFRRYWPFVRGIHRSPVNSPNKGRWRGALMFSLIC